MNDSSTVLVRWTQRSAWPTTHSSNRREPGNEDLLQIGEARALERAGLVEIVGSYDVAVQQVFHVVANEGDDDGTDDVDNTLSPVEG